jgi:hypothetical protein
MPGESVRRADSEAFGSLISDSDRSWPVKTAIDEKMPVSLSPTSSQARATPTISYATSE